MPLDPGGVTRPPVPTLTPNPGYANGACPRRDGQAEWTRVAAHVPRWFARPETVTHPTINRARRRVTLLTRVHHRRRYHYAKASIRPIEFESSNFPCKVHVQNWRVIKEYEKNEAMTLYTLCILFVFEGRLSAQ